MSLTCQAQNGSGNPIDLNVGYINPSDKINQNPRNPIQVPIVYLDGCTLTFASDCSNYVLEILEPQEGDAIEVYTTVIPSNATTLPLPFSLSGTYIIRFIQDTLCFWGWIEL